MKRIGLVIGLALVGFACADGVGEMLSDAGEAMQDGSVPNAGAQSEPATCTMSETGPWADGGSQTIRWAEFDVDPGQTEITLCSESNAEIGPRKRDVCWRLRASWYRGTSTGFIQCGTDLFDADGTRLGGSPDPISITVHR